MPNLRPDEFSEDLAKAIAVAEAQVSKFSLIFQVEPNELQPPGINLLLEQVVVASALGTEDDSPALFSNLAELLATSERTEIVGRPHYIRIEQLEFMTIGVVRVGPAKAMESDFNFISGLLAEHSLRERAKASTADKRIWAAVYAGRLTDAMHAQLLRAVEESGGNRARGQ